MAEVNFLQEVGINAGLVVSGLFGSLLTIKKGHATKLSAIALSIATGVGSANYITPIVADSLNLTNRNMTFGIAFILGFLGLRGIEMVLEKVMPQAAEEVKKTRTPAKKPAVRKKPTPRK
jgi:hypothetical protein